jgi:hypothetical protein
MAAEAAGGHATDQGLLIQWRCHRSNQVSRLLGRELGSVHWGRQVSFQPAGA